MEIRREITIEPPYSGKTVNSILLNQFGLTRRQISRLKYRPGGIQLDQTPARTSQTVTAGQTLSIYLYEKNQKQNENLPEAGRPPSIPILYEDEHLLAVDKPAGLTVHPSPGHEKDSLLDILRPACGSLFLTSRLDKDTSGILILAKYPAIVCQIKARKTYQALIQKADADRQRQLQHLPWTIQDPLQTIVVNRHARTVTEPDGKPAITIIEKAEACGQYVLLTVSIATGRMHQIRAHLACHAIPLAGDPIYGKEGDPSFLHTMLHCCQAQFRHPVTGQTVDLKAGLPKSWPVHDSSPK